MHKKKQLKDGPYGKWLKLVALMPSIAMIFTDQSILPVALPSIQDHLGATNTQLWWCINAYLLSSGVLLLAGGKIGDRIGHRAAFLLGMIIFTLSSALCGLSFNIKWLILSRGLQGVGAALMIPASSVLIMSFFPPNQRGKATGINVSVSSLFLISAPLLGGYLTETLSWRWIFWINIPIALVGVILVLLFISPSVKSKQNFDPQGFLYFFIAVTGVTMLIMQGREWGLASPKSISLLIAILLAVYLFYLREKKAKRHALIDLTLFRHPIYRAVNISIFSVQFVLMISVYRAVFFQEALGWSPLKSGLIFSLTSTPVLFMSVVGGWLADRSGPKVPIAIGFSLLISSFFWLAFFVEGSLPVIILGLLAYGFGIPLIFTPSYSSAMSSIPPSKAGEAFGILSTVRALSATAGVAAISSLDLYLLDKFFRQYLQADPYAVMLPFQDLLDSQLQESQIRSFTIIHLIMGILLILAFAYVFVHYNRKAKHHVPELPAEGWD